jgi:acyl transferase domain-containing protein
LASINSFGFGGTNAHCIVEAAPERKRSVDFTQASSTPPQLFILSAKTEKSLKANIERLNSWTSDAEQEFDMGDLAYTLATRRSMMLWRWSTVASDRQSLIAALSQKGLRLEKAAGQQRMIFLFTGQGAQWHAMGREVSTISIDTLFVSKELVTRTRGY